MKILKNKQIVLDKEAFDENKTAIVYIRVPKSADKQVRQFGKRLKQNRSAIYRKIILEALPNIKIG